MSQQTHLTGRRSWFRTIFSLLPFGFLGLRSGAAIASTIQREKPRLSDRTLNRRLAGMRGSAEFAREMRDAQRDLLAYLNAHFELTPAQRRTVESFSPEAIQALSRALDRAVADKLVVKLDGCTDGRKNRALRPVIQGETLTVEVLE